MRVAVLSYPMLFQTQGGLQIQILESIEALKRRGVDAELIDPNVHRLTDFDVVHIFSAINGNHRIAERAKTFGLPVVTSPLIRPHWDHRLGRRARWIERAVGRLTGWNVKTEYRAIHSCLQHSDVLVALGDTERSSIVEAFRIPAERVRVIPNGIPARFFAASPALAHERLGGDAGFVLNVATIDPHKNQLALARALAASGRRLVLAGQCLPSNRGYLEQLIACPHVTYAGKLDYADPLLPSLYAAADIFCLPSLSEVMPLSVLESLAAGTPVVCTRHHAMNTQGMADILREVEPSDEAAIAGAVTALAADAPSAERCRDAVRGYTWDAVAALLHDAYLDAVATRH